MKLLRAFWPAPLAAGALMWAAFPPLDQGWLMPIAWALLFASIRLRRGSRAGRQVLIASLTLFLPGVYWIVPLVFPLWFVVAGWCAGWETLFGWATGKFFRKHERPPLAWVVLVPAMHLLTDMLRTVVLTGFPWMLPGYSGWRNPVLLGSADLLGVHGATLALLVLGAGVAEVIARRAEGEDFAWRALVPAGVLWTLLAAWAAAKPAVVEAPGPTFLCLQPNIPQLLKEDAIRSGRPLLTSDVFWDTQEDLAAKGLAEAKATGRRVDVVVWAETMVPSDAIRPLTSGAPLVTIAGGGAGDPRPRRDLSVGRRVVAAGAGAETIAGIATLDGIEFVDGVATLAADRKRPTAYNTVVLLDAEARVHGFQDKQHLTPGGEYIPLVGLLPAGARARLEQYLEESIGFLPSLQPGVGANVMPLAGGARAGVMICYESLFPAIPRELVGKGADVLVNCSNYGWFARTDEMAQALAICAFRAAELRRAFLLVSNNGVTALIGPDGRVRQATRADELAYLIAEAPLCDSISPFAIVGEWGAWGVGAVAAGWLVVASRLRRPKGP